MANKPQGKSWSEIQMAITAVAITATLAFWSLFSTPNQNQAIAKAVETATPPVPPPPAATEQPTETALPTQSLGLRPIKIIYGGKAPVQQIIQVAAAPAKKRRSGGDGGGDSGGGGGGGVASDPGGGAAPAPAAPASTGSSKP